jgi:hypothetical protein
MIQQSRREDFFLGVLYPESEGTKIFTKTGHLAADNSLLIFWHRSFAFKF